MNIVLKATAIGIALFNVSAFAQESNPVESEVVKNDAPQGDAVPQQDGSETVQSGDCGCGGAKKK